MTTSGTSGASSPPDREADTAVPCARAPHDQAGLPVSSLAGARPPGQGAWLLVTSCQEPDEDFTVQVLPGLPAHAHGGDVLIHVSVKTAQDGPELLCAQVVAVGGGSLILAGAWEVPDLVSWPVLVRPAVQFAVAALSWLEVHGAELGKETAVSLDAGDEAFIRALPWTPGPCRDASRM